MIRGHGQGEGEGVGGTARGVSLPEPLPPAETGRGGSAAEGEDFQAESKVLEGKEPRGREQDGQARLGAPGARGHELEVSLVSKATLGCKGRVRIHRGQGLPASLTKREAQGHRCDCQGCQPGTLG